MPWYLGVLLTVLVPLTLINTYIGWKITSAVSTRFGSPRRRTALVVSGVLLLLNAMPLAAFATYLIAGREAMGAFSGDSGLIDALLVYPFWVTLVISVQAVVLFLAWDTVRILATRVFRRSVERWNRASVLVTFAVIGAVSLYSLPTIYIQTQIPRVEEVTIPIPARFQGLDGLRIAQISDVQGDGRTDKPVVERFVEQINALHPDMVMNCGDIVTTGDAYIDRTAEALSHLVAPEGLYAAVGDHDIFTGNKHKVIEAMRRGRHTMLEDTSIIIRHNEVPIGLTFVTYTYRERPREGKLDSLLVQPDSLYRILLVHQPAMALIGKAVDAGYDLVLAGHTHGGGVAFGLPGLGFVAPASFETTYISGLYHAGSTYVNVTTGLGFTLAPIRFNAPIEISLLTLKVSEN